MIYLYQRMRTGSLICLLVRKCLCVSISRGKPSIYFLLNIGYPNRQSVVSHRRRRPPPLSVRPSRRPSRRRRRSSVRPSMSARRRPSSGRPSTSVRRRRPPSVRPFRRPSNYS